MIVRLYGKADSLDIVFTKNEHNIWTCSVPPDLKDGRYVVALTGVDAAGFICYYTGILYMCDGRFVCIDLVQDDIICRLLDDDLTCEPLRDNLTCEPLTDNVNLVILSDRITLSLNKRGCRCV